MQNSFGHKICKIKDLFHDDRVDVSIRQILIRVFHYLGISSDKSDEIIDECINIAKNYDTLESYERSAHEILKKEGVVEELPKKLDKRAHIIFNQIKPYLLDGSILDLGCGDGRVGQLVADFGHHVVLAGICENENIENIKLPFKIFKKNQPLPYGDNEFINTLVLTVLHHSDDPLFLLKEIHRVTKDGGRVLVRESVYGVTKDNLSKVESVRGKYYLDLTAEQQKMVNIFFDHFYSTIILYSEDPEKKIKLPFNFNTPGGWKTFFEANGFDQEKVDYLGVDQPTVPEYHTLHVLRVIK